MDSKTKKALQTMLVVFVITTLLAFALGYTNYTDQKKFFENTLSDEFAAYTQLLDYNFRDESNLQNLNLTDEALNFFMMNNPAILSTDVLMFDINGDLRVFESSDDSRIGSLSKNENYIREIALEKHPYEPHYEQIEGTYNFLVVSFIPSEDGSVSLGAYELVVCKQDDFKQQEIRLNNIVAISLFFIGISSIAAFFITKRSVLK